MAKKPEKWDKPRHNFVIFSQATGQTWYRTSAYHLSTLANSEAFKPSGTCIDVTILILLNELLAFESVPDFDRLYALF